MAGCLSRSIDPLAPPEADDALVRRRGAALEPCRSRHARVCSSPCLCRETLRSSDRTGPPRLCREPLRSRVALRSLGVARCGGGGSSGRGLAAVPLGGWRGMRPTVLFLLIDAPDGVRDRSVPGLRRLMAPLCEIGVLGGAFDVFWIGPFFGTPFALVPVVSELDAGGGGGD